MKSLQTHNNCFFSIFHGQEQNTHKENKFWRKPTNRSTFHWAHIGFSQCSMTVKSSNFSMNLIIHSRLRKTKKKLKSLYLLAFCTNPCDDDSWCRSLSTQHDQIIPPEHESTGFPPAKTHDILNPHSNRLPLYLHVCGITENVYTNRNQKSKCEKQMKKRCKNNELR